MLPLVHPKQQLRDAIRGLQAIYAERSFRSGRDVLFYKAPLTLNWGDAINGWLVRRLSRRPAVQLDLEADAPADIDWPRFAVVGSILEWADPQTTVWGSGSLVEDLKLQPGSPRSVCAVRGPLTRKLLEERGIPCPEVYGDPALLFPLLADLPPIRPRYRLGVVAHFKDLKSKTTLAQYKRLTSDPSCRLINIKAGRFAVAKQILSCQAIISSSLHGLVLADAFDRPSRWVRPASQLRAGDFKYRDYFLSMSRGAEEPLALESCSSIDFAMREMPGSPRTIDLAPLVDACPFIDPGVRDALMRKLA